VLLAERCAITGVIQSEPALHGIDVDKANQVLNDYISALEEDGDAAKAILTDKVRRMAGDYKRSRTLMRIAYLVISADYTIEDREMSEFRRICGVLGLEPNQIWRESEAITAQRGELGLS
jgi:tellurite resistance protein TerB